MNHEASQATGATSQKGYGLPAARKAGGAHPGPIKPFAGSHKGVVGRRNQSNTAGTADAPHTQPPEQQATGSPWLVEHQERMKPDETW